MAATAPPPPSLHHAVNAFTAPWMTHQLQQHHLQPLSATIAERCHHWRRTIVRCPHHVRTTAPARTRFANQSGPALRILRALTPAAMETTFSIARMFEPTEEEGITILTPECASSRSYSLAKKRKTTTFNTTPSWAHNEQTSQMCNVPLSALTNRQHSSLRASHQRSAATPPTAVHPSLTTVSIFASRSSEREPEQLPYNYRNPFILHRYKSNQNLHAWARSKHNTIAMPSMFLHPRTRSE